MKSVVSFAGRLPHGRNAREEADQRKSAGNLLRDSRGNVLSAGICRVSTVDWSIAAPVAGSCSQATGLLPRWRAFLARLHAALHYADQSIHESYTRLRGISQRLAATQRFLRSHNSDWLAAPVAASLISIRTAKDVPFYKAGKPVLSIRNVPASLCRPLKNANDASDWRIAKRKQIKKALRIPAVQAWTTAAETEPKSRWSIRRLAMSASASSLRRVPLDSAT